MEKTIYSQRNLTMLMDFYELTMSKGYFNNHLENTEAVFDMFYRKNPDDGGFVITAGLAQVIEYLQNLHFSDEDIQFLRTKNFNEEFLDYLKNFKFTCDVYAVKEGTPVFPYEPIVTVVGPLIQAQLIETMVLLTINHQSLIATKASRIVRNANGAPVMEFGSRRAQGYDAAIYGARAAYIGGCTSTACTIAEEMFKIPAVGTMAHSFIQFFDNEYEAFKAYAKEFPDNCTLLVDTYNVLKLGVPNAIKVFNEVIVPLGFRPKGIRLDSGDIAYLSKEARKMLDKAGFEDCKIIASNSLDEYIVKSLFTQGAKIDGFGIGEKLITSATSPVLGGVYKLVAVKEKNEFIPKIKVSENIEKITNPHFKKVYRLYDKYSHKALADIMTIYNEEINFTKPIKIQDINHSWKQKEITNYYAKELLVPIFSRGKLVYHSPSVQEIQKYCKNQLKTLWKEVLRIENPHVYYVDLSEKLLALKKELLHDISEQFSETSTIENE